MADTERLTAEFLVCGITGFTGGFLEGNPTFSPVLSAPNQVIADLIYAAHVEDPAAYIDTSHDMRTKPACIAIFNVVTPEQWDAYREIQRKYVKYARRQRMREACCLEKVTPGDLKDKWLQTNAPEDRTAWLAALVAIANALPYPSGQTD